MPLHGDLSAAAAAAKNTKKSATSATPPQSPTATLAVESSTHARVKAIRAAATPLQPRKLSFGPTHGESEEPTSLQFKDDHKLLACAFATALEVYFDTAEIIRDCNQQLHATLASALVDLIYKAGQMDENGNIRELVTTLESVFRTISTIDPQHLDSRDTNVEAMLESFGEQQNIDEITDQVLGYLMYGCGYLSKLLHLMDTTNDSQEKQAIIAGLIDNISNKLIPPLTILTQPLSEKKLTKLNNGFSKAITELQTFVKTLRLRVSEKEQSAVKETIISSPPSHADRVRKEFAEQIAATRRDSLTALEEGDRTIAELQEEVSDLREHNLKLANKLAAIRSGQNSSPFPTPSQADGSPLLRTSFRASSRIASTHDELDSAATCANDAEKEQLRAEVEELKKQLKSRDKRYKIEEQRDAAQRTLEQANAVNLTLQDEILDLRDQLAQAQQSAAGFSERLGNISRESRSQLTPSRQIRLQKAQAAAVATSPLRRLSSASRRTPKSRLRPVAERSPSQQDTQKDIVVATIIYCSELTALRILLIISSQAGDHALLMHHTLSGIVTCSEHNDLKRKAEHDSPLKTRMHEMRATSASSQTALFQPATKEKGRSSHQASSSLTATTTNTAVNRALGHFERMRNNLDAQAKQSPEFLHDELAMLVFQKDQLLSKIELLEVTQGEINTLQPSADLGVSYNDIDSAESYKRKSELEELKSKEDRLIEEINELFDTICSKSKEYITATSLNLHNHLVVVCGHLTSLRYSLFSYLASQLNANLLLSTAQMADDAQIEQKLTILSKQSNLIWKIANQEKLTTGETELAQQEGYSDSTEENLKAILSELEAKKKEIIAEKDRLKTQRSTFKLKQIADDHQPEMTPDLRKKHQHGPAEKFLDSVTVEMLDGLKAICNTVLVIIKDRLASCGSDSEIRNLEVAVNNVSSKIRFFENAKLHSKIGAQQATEDGSNYEDNSIIADTRKNINRRLKAINSKNNFETFSSFLDAIAVIETTFINQFGAVGHEKTTVDNINENIFEFKGNREFASRLNKVDRDIFLSELTILFQHYGAVFMQGSSISRIIIDEFEAFLSTCERKDHDKRAAVEAMVRNKSAATLPMSQDGNGGASSSVPGFGFSARG